MGVRLGSGIEEYSAVGELDDGRFVWISEPFLIVHDEVAGLPSSPERPLVLMDAPGRPQPRLDISDGMTVAVGNLSEDPTYDVRFTVLVHNLVRGAAGACLLNAELAVVRQLVGIPRKPPGRIRHRPQRDATRPSS